PPALRSFLHDALPIFLVVIVAEYEQCLQRVFKARAEKASDPHLTKVVAKWAYQAKNRMKLEDLKGHLRVFDDSCLDCFSAVTTQDRKSTRLNSSHRTI